MGYGTDGLTFNTLRRGNAERQKHFKNAKGKVVPDWSADRRFLAVVGELGEFANLLKKAERGDFTIDEIRSDLADELADAVTYIDLLANKLKIDLGQAVMDKFNRVSERVGSNVWIDAEDWHRR